MRASAEHGLRCCRVAVALVAHYCTAAWWPGYGRLPTRQRLAWTNRISSALHVRVPAISCYFPRIQLGYALPATPELPEGPVDSYAGRARGMRMRS